jgi:hypothetical protein
MTTVLLALAIFIALVMLVLVILLLVILSERLRRAKNLEQDTTGPIFDGLSSFFTPPERELVHALGDSLGHHYRVFGKVCLADMIVPTDSVPNATRRRLRARAERRRVDIVLCRADDFSVLGAIEVIDPAEVRPNHVRSGFMEDALSSAGIPLLRIPAQLEYDLLELLEQVNAAFGLGESPPARKPKAAPEPEPAPQPEPVKASTVAPAPLVVPNSPNCGDCGADMVRRVSRGSDGNAHKFWGCSRFPECSFVKPMTE